jgi:hypothetical protein
MARFVNETSSALTSYEHGWQAGPGGELDWPAYDPDSHGATPGLRRLDADDPPAPRRRKPRTDDPAGGSGDDSGDGAGSGTGDDAQASNTEPPDGTATDDAAPAASEENPQ